MIQVTQPIVSYAVVDSLPLKVAVKPTLMARTEALTGCTYKIKTPLSEHALYITINNLEIDGQLRPFELFINSKSMEHFQWIVAFTRIVSAIFRQGGEVNFLIEELRSVFCPKGGYFQKGKYVPSLVAEIGDVIERHLSGLGVYVKDTSLQEAAVAMIAEKKSSKPELLLCANCNELAVVMMDGCLTCTNCGSSKCG